MAIPDVNSRLAKVISAFFDAEGRQCPKMTRDTKLVRDLGLSSDDGVLLVLDLCNEFHVVLPDDFNAVVHDSGSRDRTFGELAARIDSFILAKEPTK